MQGRSQVAHRALVAWVTDLHEEEGGLVTPALGSVPDQQGSALPVELEHAAFGEDHVGAGALVSCGRIVLGGPHEARDGIPRGPDLLGDTGCQVHPSIGHPRPMLMRATGGQDSGPRVDLVNRSPNQGQRL